MLTRSYQIKDQPARRRTTLERDDLVGLRNRRRLRSDEKLEHYTDYRDLHITGDDLGVPDVRGCGFINSVFSSLETIEGELAECEFTSSLFDQVRFIRTSMVGCRSVDSRFTSTALLGVDLSGSLLRRVRFHDCKLERVNFKFAKFEHVSFDECSLVDVHFGDATLKSVAFPGSNLDAIHVQNSHLDKVDLRQVANLGTVDNVFALRGAVISSPQLVDLAAALAQRAGIIVD
jgi:uncharacterized protein YjbI with pentapeptide repeats